MKTKYPMPTEDQEQALIFEWAHYARSKHPQLDLLFAIPNGGYRCKATAARMKRTGTKAGVPDMFLAYPNGEYHGLFIELKRQEGGKVSDQQVEWMQRLSDQGYMCCVCMGADMAIRVIEAYLVRPEMVYMLDL